MTDPIAYALAWLAVAALMMYLNIKAIGTWLKVVSLLSMFAAIATCVLTLLGVVGVPA